MKKIFLALIAAISVFALQLPIQSALAAPAIKIFKAATGSEGVSSFTVPKDAGKSSWPVYIALSEAPNNTVTLKVSDEGAAVFYWTGSDNLVFTKDNWNERRRLVFEYQATAQPGAKGRITLSGNGVASREILFTVEGSSTTSGTGTTGGTGGSNATGGTSSDPTKLAENITTDDLDKLGFSKISVDELVTKGIRGLLGLIAITAFFSLLYSGFMYITAGGDSDKATKARRNILWALMGIIIAILSYFVVFTIATTAKKAAHLIIPVAYAQNQDISSSGGASALLPDGGIIPKCIRDPELSRTAGISCVTESIVHFTNILLLGVAIGSFIYLLFGAFLYVSAFGDEKKIEQAKKSITYAIVGLAVALLANLFVTLVKSSLGVS